MIAFLEPFEASAPLFGSRDCGLFPADWVRHQTGVDPASPWRGLYDDEKGAEAFVRDGGGLLAVFTRAAALAALPRARRPMPGAVGVVRHSGVPGGCLGAIYLGGSQWVMLPAEGGIMSSSMRPLRAWQVPV